jgi:hypothetical protein
MAGITSTKKIRGQPHLLAYITPNEVEKLKALGGQETMTKEGIPAYPERDNYGFSSDADFNSGDVSKSNDPNVRNVGTFETYQGKKNIGVDLALKAKHAKDKKDREDAQKALDKGQTYGYGPNQSVFEKFGTYDRNYKTNFVNRQIDKKKKALKDYLTSKYTRNPHMDVDEIMEGIMGSYDPATQTFGSYTFDKGLNKGFDFDLNNYAKGTQLGAFGLSANKKYGDKGKLGTKYLDSTPDFTSHPSTMPSVMGQILGKVNPMNMNTLKSNLNRMNLLETMKIGGVTQSKIDDYFDKTNRRGKYGDPVYGDGDGQQPYIPIDYNTGAATVEAVEPYTNDFAYRFGTGQNVGDDVTQGFYNQGGRVPRAFGGIMDSNTGRKAYGLGSVFKSVGKAVSGVAKAAGKVLSSDVGKMALAAGAFYYGGGGGMPKFLGGKGLGGFSPTTFFSKANPLLFSANKAGEQVFNPMKFAGLTTAIGAMGGPAKVDQMPGDDGTRGGRLIDPLTGEEGTPASMRANIENAKIEAGGDPDKLAALNQAYNNMLFSNLPYANYGNYAQGGRIKAEEGGLMNLGGMEKDYRAEGGFVPIGKAEKADDVPARLSVNEFVFTADAVRNAGGGDIDKGAEVMENMMKNLENGGRVSEESQGNAGAQEMFSVSERIGEVI